MQFLRSIQLDDSDTQVFHHAAAAGEWAVPGSFALLDLDPATPDRKLREAFRHGFVGTRSFGHTSLVTVADISSAELAALISRIRIHLCTHCGAPSEQAAQQLAAEEVGFTLEIAAHPTGTLIAVDRALTAAGIEEHYRTVASPTGVDHSHMRLWALED